MEPKYYMSEGKVYEFCGRDAFGRLEGRLTDLKEIPVEEPLPKPNFVMNEAPKEEVEKPKRGRRKA